MSLIPVPCWNASGRCPKSIREHAGLRACQAFEIACCLFLFRYAAFGERVDGDKNLGGARPHESLRAKVVTIYSLRGSNPRPMAHKTIALTTDLREQ